MTVRASVFLLFAAACSSSEPQAELAATSTTGVSTSQSVGAGGATGSGSGAETSAGPGGSSSVIGLDCGSAPLALLCDDFEGGAIDDSKWIALSNGGGSVGVDDVVVLDGYYALHVVLPSAPGANGILRAAPGLLFPLAENAFYGRAFLHLAGAVPDTHSKLINARGELEDGEPAQWRLDCNGGDLNSRYTTPSIDEVVHGGLKKFGYEVPADAWLCVEWHYDGANNEMRYWIDGEAIDGMTVLASEDPPWIAPQFEVFEIGWHTFQAGNTAPEYHVFYDSIVLDTSRIGCGR